MIWSSWGITTLEYNEASLFPSRIYSNGTWLGGWLLNTADNVYCGSGHYDNDAREDMVVMSLWGLGIISLQGGSHLYIAPNGSRFGGWLLNTGDNTVRLIADLDGGGMDEIFISSPGGIGVLKMVDGELSSVAMHPNGDDLGGYIVRNTNNFALADNLKGSAEKQILVIDGLGIYMLCLIDNRIVAEICVTNGTRIDGWVIDSSHDQFQHVGDMNADGRAEFVIRSPWGIGIMGVDGTNRFCCYSMFPYSSMLNDWYLQSGDVIVGPGNLSGNSDRKELLITKP